MILSIIVVFVTCEIFLHQVYPRRLAGGRKRRRRMEYGRYALAAGILLVLAWWSIAMPVLDVLGRLSQRLPALDSRHSPLSEPIALLQSVALIVFMTVPLSAAASVASSFMPGRPTDFQLRAMALLPMELVLSAVTAQVLYDGLIDTGPRLAEISCAYGVPADGRPSVRVTATYANDGEDTFAVWTPPLELEQAVEPATSTGPPREADWKEDPRWWISSLAGTPGTLVLKPRQRGTVNALYEYGDPGEAPPPLTKGAKLYCGLGNRGQRDFGLIDMILNRNPDAAVVEWTRIRNDEPAEVNGYPSK